MKKKVSEYLNEEVEIATRNDDNNRIDDLFRVTFYLQKEAKENEHQTPVHDYIQYLLEKLPNKAVINTFITENDLTINYNGHLEWDPRSL